MFKEKYKQERLYYTHIYHRNKIIFVFVLMKRLNATSQKIYKFAIYHLFQLQKTIIPNTMIQQPQAIDQNTNYHFFFFVNTKSGYGEGKQYFAHNFTQIKFKYESHRIAFIYLADLFNQQQKFNQLQIIKKFADQKQSNLRIIISGGDGTIVWVVNQLIATGIDPNLLVFGINPIGTGNDFSRSVGWGFQPLIKVGPKFKQQLAHQILKWMNTAVGKYDLWDVEIETYPEGEIYDIKNQVEIRKDERRIQKMFSNYVGMGLDARVVYTVQRKRTKNAFFNKIIYGCVGFCNFFRTLKKLDSLSFVSETATQLSEKLNIARQKEESTIRETDVSDLDQMITNTETLKFQKVSVGVKEEETVYKLKKGYRGVVCLNCPSYMCGLRHIWHTKKIAQQNSEQCHFKPQRYDDGEVEFIAYKNELDLALERVMRSGAKLAQGGGPFRLVLQKVTKKQDEDNFIQIDGESIKVVNLKQVRIQRTDKIKGSQLNVMFNNLIQ